jgi:acyl-CoA thioesterase FadM
VVVSRIRTEKEENRMAEKFRFSITVKPRYGDEFAGTGVVDDLCYHVWARTAFLAYVNHLGIEIPLNSWAAPIRIEAVYQIPLLVKEEAKVYVRTTRIGRSSNTQEAQINEVDSGRLVATLTYVGVIIDGKTGRSIPNTDEWKQKVIAFEGKENVQIAQS